MLVSCGGAPAAGGGTVVWRGRAAEAFTSETFTVAPFDRAVLSWNASGTAAFEIEAAGTWFSMGPSGAKSESVDVDTLTLKPPATSFRFRVTPVRGTTVTLVAVATWMKGTGRPYAERRSAAWGRVIEVPCRSQWVETKDPGSICSPTSLSMVLEHHGLKKSTREVCEGVYDPAAKIYGNWPLNTAYAHAAGGFESYVARAGGLEEVEEEIAAGRPVVLSHRWNAGDLDGAPIASSDGHLIVVVGFTEAGDVVVNDPAAKLAGVRRTYSRRQVWTTFLGRGSGVFYVVRAAG